jgi:hypothetical protein
MIPIIFLFDLDFDVYASGEVQLRERVDGCGAAVEDIDETLVRLELELLA